MDAVTASAPPKHVCLLHRMVGKYHVFTCPDIPGLHISNSDRGRALSRAVSGLSVHASSVYSRQVKYRLEAGADEAWNRMEMLSGEIPMPVLCLQLEGA